MFVPGVKFVFRRCGVADSQLMRLRQTSVSLGRRLRRFEMIFLCGASPSKDSFLMLDAPHLYEIPIKQALFPSRKHTLPDATKSSIAGGFFFSRPLMPFRKMHRHNEHLRLPLIRSGAMPKWSHRTPKEFAMTFDYSLAGLVTAGLLVYLVYALLRPERF